ncbi:MAG: class II SORL domain-containing protein [Candidatus Omnitrophica bacterium]|nr:class II SORL domain-containing protein [Candidatus Omnitrophota bacterium]
MKDIIQSADWKKEKHVPVIEADDTAKKGACVSVNISVGKEIAHPNTTEHHIAWISVYFLADGEKFPFEIGKFEFNAHGASAQGPNTSTIYSCPQARCCFKTEKSGTIISLASCNIHGLWESSKKLTIE